MTYFDKLNLQLFADGGDGAAGVDGGASASAVGSDAAAPVAEEQRLRDLGIPEDVLRKRAERRAKNGTRNRVDMKLPTAAAAPQAPAQLAPADETEPTAAPTAAPTRMSWEEIVADPEYNEHLQRTVSGRVKTAKAAAQNMDDMREALALLAQEHGQDSANIDYKALAQSIMDNSKAVEERAIEMNVSKKQAKRVMLDEINARQQKEAEAQQQQEDMLRSHFDTLRNEFGQLQTTFPNANLQAELKNPKFAFAVQPGSKLTAEDAYWAANHKQLLAAERANIEREVSERFSASVQSGQRRPPENGIAAQAGSTSQFTINMRDRQQREAFSAQIAAAARRGEKISPRDVKILSGR